MKEFKKRVQTTLKGELKKKFLTDCEKQEEDEAIVLRQIIRNYYDER